MNSNYQLLSTFYSNPNYNNLDYSNLDYSFKNNLTNNTLNSNIILSQELSQNITPPSYDLNINNNISYNDMKETNYMHSYFVDPLMQNSNQNLLPSFEKISSTKEILQILQQFVNSTRHPINFTDLLTCLSEKPSIIKYEVLTQYFTNSKGFLQKIFKSKSLKYNVTKYDLLSLNNYFTTSSDPEIINRILMYYENIIDETCDDDNKLTLINFLDDKDKKYFALKLSIFNNEEGFTRDQVIVIINLLQSYENINHVDRETIFETFIKSHTTLLVKHSLDDFIKLCLIELSYVLTDNLVTILRYRLYYLMTINHDVKWAFPEYIKNLKYPEIAMLMLRTFFTIQSKYTTVESLNKIVHVIIPTEIKEFLIFCSEFIELDKIELDKIYKANGNIKMKKIYNFIKSVKSKADACNLNPRDYNEIVALLVKFLTNFLTKDTIRHYFHKIILIFTDNINSDINIDLTLTILNNSNLLNSSTNEEANAILKKFETVIDSDKITSTTEKIFKIIIASFPSIKNKEKITISLIIGLSDFSFMIYFNLLYTRISNKYNKVVINNMSEIVNSFTNVDQHFICYNILKKESVEKLVKKIIESKIMNYKMGMQFLANAVAFLHNNLVHYKSEMLPLFCNYVLSFTPKKNLLQLALYFYENIKTPEIQKIIQKNIKNLTIEQLAQIDIKDLITEDNIHEILPQIQLIEVKLILLKSFMQYILIKSHKSCEKYIFAFLELFISYFKDHEVDMMKVITKYVSISKDDIRIKAHAESFGKSYNEVRQLIVSLHDDNV